MIITKKSKKMNTNQITANAMLNNVELRKENEILKARCETYKKDYEDMIAEFIKLSGENSKMKEMISSMGRLGNLANDLLKK
jgi:cell division protein FtsB